MVYYSVFNIGLEPIKHACKRLGAKAADYVAYYRHTAQYSSGHARCHATKYEAYSIRGDPPNESVYCIERLLHAPHRNRREYFCSIFSHIGLNRRKVMEC